MGSKQFKGGSLTLNLDREFQTPGSDVTGEAVLTLQQAYPSSTLCIALTGEECVKYDRAKKIIASLDSIYPTFKLCSETTTLTLGSDPSLEPGIYRCPFKLPLMSGLP